MSLPFRGVGKEGQSNVTLLSSSTSMESICCNDSEIKERNYMGLSDCSSFGRSTISLLVEDNKDSLNLKATELRLGLPGSQSPERDPDVCSLSSAKLEKKPLIPLHPVKDGSYSFTQKTVVSGNKRVFSDAMDGFSEAKFLGNSEASVMLSPSPSNLGGKSGPIKENPGSQSVKMKEASQNVVKERSHTANEATAYCASAANSNGNSPATKAQVIGWPPIGSFRKSKLAPTSKNADEVDGKAGPGALFVKVSMDGAPYLRKVDLKTYSAYQELSSALEKMFSCFTIGQYGSHGAPGREMLSESKLRDLLNGSEYVLTYEDKDGDWMLVGDVPWEMFIDTCRRLRIIKSSDAIGLAPRAVQKCRNGN